MTPVELMTDGYTAPGIMDLLLKQLPLVGMNPIMVKKESTGDQNLRFYCCQANAYALYLRIHLQSHLGSYQTRDHDDIGRRD